MIALVVIVLTHMQPALLIQQGWRARQKQERAGSKATEATEGVRTRLLRVSSMPGRSSQDRRANSICYDIAIAW